MAGWTRVDLAFRLATESELGEITVKSGSNVFIDGDGQTLQIFAKNQVTVEPGASLCLYNVKLKGGKVCLVYLTVGDPHIRVCCSVIYNEHIRIMHLS